MSKTFQQLNEEVEDFLLIESIAAENTGPFLSEDLAQIVKTHKKNQWSPGLSSDELGDHLEAIRQKALKKC